MTARNLFLCSRGVWRCVSGRKCTFSNLATASTTTATVPHLVKCHSKETTKILAVLYAGK